ncbi:MULTISPECIES: hypothetical protein [Bacillaceae]|uniref:Uncharacterized protein n=1 Tax=Peribacillus huizhouensis TaxID=1501239 RepID=A0ABR6CMW3_9BACI|nr:MULTISPECIES: hypothetical protein [Bacillaceae]MBA9026372.1 hypothetical protein [Peribacillus huizhouensis]
MSRINSILDRQIKYIASRHGKGISNGTCERAILFFLAGAWQGDILIAFPSFTIQ